MQKLTIVLMCLIFLLMTKITFAGEIDVLMKKLSEKGILTKQEAEIILFETKEVVKNDLAAGKLDTVPQWVQNTTLSGDLRLRFENRERAIVSDQNKTSMRFRYGFETKAAKEIKVGARLASGSSQNQTSKEQTLDDSFKMKSIWLDLAYLEYAANKNLKLIAGKIKNPFYAVHDLIWDSDVNPEGGVFQYNNTLSCMDKEVEYFANLGILPLDGVNNISPVIYTAQTGFSMDIFGLGRTLKSGVSYYGFDDLKGTTYGNVSPNYSKLTNTLTTTSASTAKFVYDYQVLDINLEYSLLDITPFGNLLPLNLLGAYVKNMACEVKKDSAWFLGFQLGKAKLPGTWDFSYNYRRIAADATVDFLNDAAFHAGGTNAKGHKFGITYVPIKNTNLTLTYFATEKVTGVKTSGDVLETLQLDLTVKF